MSIDHRVDPPGFAERASELAADSAFADASGLPHDRLARIAARRAFVDMKQLFLRAVENLEHRKGAWLRAQVRGAEDTLDLWLLRGPLLATLREDELATRDLRAQLYKSLDNTFVDGFARQELPGPVGHRF